MAGAGVRLFTAGSILTAQQVNEYLMDQTICVFNDSAARDAAFGGVGEPVLSEGRIAYLKSDDTLYIYTGSAWVEVQSGIPGTAGQVVVYNSSGDPIAQTLSGDVTINSSGVTAIASGVVVNADVSASAAIALSKLASGTAGQVVVHNASGVPTATTITGDVTVTSAGVTAIGSGVIVNADVNASAAIAYSKLNLASSLVNADISSSAAIEISKIADVTIDTKTSNYTLQLSDKNKFIEMNLAGANTVSVPTNSVAFPIGSQIHITQYGAGKTQVVAVTPGTTTIRSTPGTYLRAQYSSATLIKRATEEWYLVGDLSAT